jgi:hypothetical protein
MSEVIRYYFEKGVNYEPHYLHMAPKRMTEIFNRALRSGQINEPTMKRVRDALIEIKQKAIEKANIHRH